jgi:hypothetical protein
MHDKIAWLRVVQDIGKSNESGRLDAPGIVGLFPPYQYHYNWMHRALVSFVWRRCAAGEIA